MKILISILFFSISISVFSQSTINNLDFEDGNFNNWVTSVGHVNVIGTSPSHPFIFDSIGIIDSGNYFNSSHSIEDTLSKYDVNLPLVKTVCPFTNSNSVRLGDFSGGYKASRIHTIMTVNSTDTLFNFFYSYIADDPSHPLGKQPYFYFEILDSIGGSLTLLDSILMPSSASLNKYGIKWKYSGWRHQLLNFGPYIGKKIMIRITNGDCGWGGHEGRVYIDFSSNDKVNIKLSNLCLNDSVLFAGNYVKNSGYYYDTTWVGGLVDSVSILKVTVVNQGSIIPVLANYQTNICMGDTTKVTCNISSRGKDSTTYDWYINGIKSNISNSSNLVFYSNLNNSIYCIVKNYESGCVRTEISDTIAVMVNPKPTVNLVTISTNLKAIASGGTTPYSYEWHVNWSTLPGSNSIITPIYNGKYLVIVKDSNNCIAKDSIPSYNVSLKENVLDEKLNFYPNPTTNKIILELSNEKGIVTILDFQGKEVYKTFVDKYNNTIELDNLSKGVYFLNLKLENGERRRGKVVLK